MKELPKVGSKIYYPSKNGIALICEVVGFSESDVLLSIGDQRYYIPRTSVLSHAIPIEEERSKMYISQRLEDPDNKIVYLRYKWQETLFDRAYNAYCSALGRGTGPLVIDASEPEDGL